MSETSALCDCCERPLGNAQRKCPHCGVEFAQPEPTVPTPDRLAAIKARAEKTTDGPWQVVRDLYEPQDGKASALVGKVAQRRIFTGWDHPQMKGPIGVVNSYMTIGKVCGESPHRGVSISAEDADFIVHAREDVPYLLNLVEQLLAEALEASGRRACACSTPDPVMQADRKFYCQACSFETGARPSLLQPEDILKSLNTLVVEWEAKAASDVKEVCYEEQVAYAECATQLKARLGTRQG